mmetsp:Transcript_10277/g.19573  ORF Transcript_10277/g.19573 Transcript_10277/m.19573 type:complete len:588 (-) Transcript_10277:106-1869(-)
MRSLCIIAVLVTATTIRFVGAGRARHSFLRSREEQPHAKRGLLATNITHRKHTQPEDDVGGGEESEEVGITYAHPPHRRSLPTWDSADTTVTGGIISNYERRTWWGFPNYNRDLDTGPKSWEAFAREHGHRGQLCSTAHVRRQCGTAFVCRRGVCSECVLSRDCGEQYVCIPPSPGGHSLCVPRALSEQFTWKEVFATFLIVVTAVLSAAAGMGGGGVYVPLLLLLLGLSTQEAVPLSQAMIVGGATVNVIMFCGDRHPKFPHMPKIDYKVVMMLNPGLAAGVTIGVMLNVIAPQWVIVVVLVVTLVLALQKSLTKGLKEWEKESKALAKAAEAAKVKGASAEKTGGPINIKLADFKSFLELAEVNQRPLGLIGGLWLVFLFANLMKAEPCSMAFWFQQLGLLFTCGAFTVMGARSLGMGEGKDKKGVEEGSSDEGMLAWTPETVRLYPLLSVVAGFLGGFLGIGGGIIMGPLLLELGMAAEASQATTAAFVFLSSSLATIQFIVMGKAMPEYALWFTSWVLVATFVGQTGVDYMLRKFKRSSVIVLSIAAIIAGSLVMMTAIGATDIYTDLARGAYMGFSPRLLCQ